MLAPKARADFPGLTEKEGFEPSMQVFTHITP